MGSAVFKTVGGRARRVPGGIVPLALPPSRLSPVAVATGHALRVEELEHRDAHPAGHAHHAAELAGGG